jgi:hypothetical protein
MTTLITVLIVLATFIMLLLIIPLFTRKEYAIEREITINRPLQDVFNYLKHLKNQDNFSKWVMTDPDMKKEFRGTDGTLGFVYAWDGNKQAGAGEQEIIKIAEGNRLDIEVRFLRPFAGIAKTPFITEAISADQTKVKWGMSSKMNYPANIMLIFMNPDKILGNDLEISLKTLKGILEK